MNPTASIGAVILLCTASAAQDWTSFKGFESTQGDASCFVLGRYRDGRAQFSFGDYTKSGMVRNVVGMRLRREQSGTTNYGRSWSNMQIRMGNMDFGLVTDEWAANLDPKSTKLVFSASVTFPSTSGAPSSTPAPWGAFVAANDMQFPFSTPYLHLGQAATTVDFQFTGGVLANAAAWSSTAARSYYIDAYKASGPNSWQQGRQTFHGVTTCAGTGQTVSSDFQTWLFTDILPDGTQQHRWQWYGFNYPVNTAVVGIVGLAGNANGVNFLSSCQKLYLDLSKPFLVYPFKTDAAGDYFSPFIKWPFNAATVGASIWTQAGFDDGNPASLQLSRAQSTAVPAAPPTKPTHWGSRLYHPNKNRPLGFGPYDTRNPIFLFY